MKTQRLLIALTVANSRGPQAVRLVLDASAAIEVAMNRGKGARFAQTLEEADEVLTPDLFVPEVVNTVWKDHQFEDLSLGACERALNLVGRIHSVQRSLPGGLPLGEDRKAIGI
jgi:predicted nucleic acid-binding protein